MIAQPVYPAHEHGALAGVGRAQRSTGVSASQIAEKVEQGLVAFVGNARVSGRMIINGRVLTDSDLRLEVSKFHRFQGFSGRHSQAWYPLQACALKDIRPGTQRGVVPSMDFDVLVVANPKSARMRTMNENCVPEEIEGQIEQTFQLYRIGSSEEMEWGLAERTMLT